MKQIRIFKLKIIKGITEYQGFQYKIFAILQDVCDSEIVLIIFTFKFETKILCNFKLKTSKIKKFQTKYFGLSFYCK